MVAAEEPNEPSFLDDRDCATAVFLESIEYDAEHVERSSGFEFSVHDVADENVLGLFCKRGEQVAARQNSDYAPFIDDGEILLEP